MRIGNLNVWKERTENPSIVFRVDGSSDILRCGYEELAGMMFVLRGMSESEGCNRYMFRHVIEPHGGYMLHFGNVKKFLPQKEAFILMLALEGVVKNAI